MRKVTFLDVDGVLNNVKTKERYNGKLGATAFQLIGFDPKNVAAFNAFQRVANTQIVVSSSWRCGRSVEELREILRDAGVVGEVIDKTGHALSRRRGFEIQDWLDANPVDGFVILDDSDDMEHLLPKLVRTSWAKGMLKKHVPLALKVLAEPVINR